MANDNWIYKTPSELRKEALEALKKAKEVEILKNKNYEIQDNRKKD